MSMVARRVARRGPGCPQFFFVYPHPAHPAMEMEMQGTFHCFLGASSSGYTTHKVLKRMLPFGVPNQSAKAADTRSSSSSHQVSAPPFQNLFGPKRTPERVRYTHVKPVAPTFINFHFFFAFELLLKKSCETLL
jgi:hypothetical protein